MGDGFTRMAATVNELFYAATGRAVKFVAYLIELSTAFIPKQISFSKGERGGDAKKP